MNRYSISSKEMIVLRDGRPFGEIGTFGGGALNWPMPQTLTGMCRTLIGNGRTVDFFTGQDRTKNIEAIRKIALKRLLPGLVAKGNHEPLLPVPADLVFYLSGKPAIYPMEFRPLTPGEGTDCPYSEWLYPVTGDKHKDKPDTPSRFLSNVLAEMYINGTITTAGLELATSEGACYNVLKETRIHSSIDPESRSVIDGQLYAEGGVYLQAIIPYQNNTPEEERLYGTIVSGDLHIDFDLDGVDAKEQHSGFAYLGGERRRVDVAEANTHCYLAKPANSKNQQFLKLVLTTHGDFGNWVPEWLLKTGNITDVAWAQEPRSGVEVKLRSAVIAGWDPCSGWDYEKRQPKPFRKLVKPGAVYLLELQNPEDSEKLINALHGESICQAGSAGEKDGYGQVIVAGCNPETIERVQHG